MAITYESHRPFLVLELIKDGFLFERVELNGDTLDGYSPSPIIWPIEDPYESYDEATSACKNDYADALYERFCDDPDIMLTREEANECGKIIADHARHVIAPMWEK